MASQPNAPENPNGPEHEPTADTPEQADDQASAEAGETLQAETDPVQNAPEAEGDEAAIDWQAQCEAESTRADQQAALALRLQADMENLRKRAARDVDSARKFALEKFANELLPVRDSLEMGLDAAAQDDANLDSIREGTELTLKMLISAMDKFQLVALEPLGEPFDPERHQAMTMQESAEHAPNTVMAVMQKGYTLNDRLLRPALVMVSRATEPSA